MSRGAAALKKNLPKPKKQSPFLQKFGCANVRAPAPKLFSFKGLARERLENKKMQLLSIKSFRKITLQKNDF